MRCSRAEAPWALGDLRAANDEFRQAVAADEKAVRPRVRWGRLFLTISQHGEAARLFEEALEIDAARRTRPVSPWCGSPSSASRVM